MINTQLYSPMHSYICIIVICIHGHIFNEVSISANSMVDTKATIRHRLVFLAQGRLGLD